MCKKLNLNEMLNFDDIDLTAPDIVIKELFDQLPNETNKLINGKIEKYDGPVMSYTTGSISAISSSLKLMNNQVDIQIDLGEIGTETHQFECYLYTPEYDKYHYRMFFVKYNISNYPVTIVLEESVARSISVPNGEYICICNTRIELEELIVRVLTSKRIIEVMQELIRINQAKKLSK